MKVCGAVDSESDGDAMTVLESDTRRAMRPYYCYHHHCHSPHHCVCFADHAGEHGKCDERRTKMSDDDGSSGEKNRDADEVFGVVKERKAKT